MNIAHLMHSSPTPLAGAVTGVLAQLANSLGQRFLL
jgi:hypothetical protein